MTVDEAKKAKKFFDHSFIDTSKILVDYAHPMGSSKIPRPWSKFSKGSSRYTKAHPQQLVKDPFNKEKIDVESATKPNKRQLEDDQNKLDEFMSLSKKQKLWENDIVMPKGEDETVKPEKTSKKIYADEEGSDSEEYQTIDPVDHTTQTEKDNDDNKLANDENVSDLDYLKSFQTSKLSIDMEQKDEKDEQSQSDSESDSEEEQQNTGADDKTGESEAGLNKEDEEKEKKKQEHFYQIFVPDLADSGRLFIRNLSYECKEDELRDVFSQYGELEEFHLSIDPKTGRAKGFAFVHFKIPQQALEALKELDGTIFQGRILHIIPAKLRKEKKEKDTQKEGSAYLSKYQREKQQKLQENASKAEHTWNPLYVNPNAVVGAMIEKYHVGKDQLLDPQSQNMAVRQALGETAVILETEEYLSKLGVNVELFKNGLYTGKGTIERSNNIILLKNISHNTSEADVKHIFGQHGTLSRVVVPPTKTMALVEFVHPSEAKLAFSKLAFRSLLGCPMYLEWAPVGVLKPKPNSNTEVVTPTYIVDKTPGHASDIQNEEVRRLTIESNPLQTTLFIKNINFGTTEQELKEFCSKAGHVRNVTIAKKKDPKKNGELISLGYGFVEFQSREDALNGFKILQGQVLHSHALVISLTKDTKEEIVNRKITERHEQNTKLMIRNVPFQATKKDIQALFSAFSEVKQVRLPKKPGGKGHRGFAFVEFLTVQEAKNAMQALANTHIYGRHLVIDFAKQDETVEEIRERTKTIYDKRNQ